MPKFKRTHVDGGGVSGLLPLLQSWIDVQAAYIEAMEYDDWSLVVYEIAVTDSSQELLGESEGLDFRSIERAKGG